jgi:hypothetical protein
MKKRVLYVQIGMLALLCGCGSQGEQGVQGVPGLVGPTGLTGPTGPTGPGADFNDLIFGRATDSVVVAANSDWTSNTAFTAATGHQPGDYSFGNLTLQPGVTVTVPAGVTLRFRGQLVVSAGAVLGTADGLTSDVSGGSPGVGTASIAGTVAIAVPAPGSAGGPAGLGQPYTSFIPPVPAGGSGGPATSSSSSTVSTATVGQGGGSMALRARNGIQNQGTIRCNGGDGFINNRGGGGGGFLICLWGPGSTLNNTGTLEARGGHGGISDAVGQPGGGGGGGGFIRLAGPGTATVGGTISVIGGNGSSANGVPAAGTAISPGGSSWGSGGTAFGDGNSNAGGPGSVMRTDVPDPATLFVLMRTQN